MRRASLCLGALVAALVAAFSVSPATASTTSHTQSWLCSSANVSSFSSLSRLGAPGLSAGRGEQVREPAEDTSLDSGDSHRAYNPHFDANVLVWVHVIWFGSWIGYNVLPGVKQIDPFPFTFLTLVVSLEAIFLSTFILISQNHDTQISERRNHLDLQINLLTEQENTTMISMLRAIADKVGADISNDPKVEVMSEETQPDKLVRQIEQHENEK